MNVFPVGGLDLKDAGVPQDKTFKQLHTYLYNMWKEVGGPIRGVLLVSLLNHVC